MGIKEDRKAKDEAVFIMNEIMQMLARFSKLDFSECLLSKNDITDLLINYKNGIIPKDMNVIIKHGEIQAFIEYYLVGIKRDTPLDKNFVYEMYLEYCNENMMNPVSRAWFIEELRADKRLTWFRAGKEYVTYNTARQKKQDVPF